MTENAPTLALGATIAFGSTTAVGWIPSALISRSRLAGLRSGEPDLSHDDRVLADLDVVTDLDEVVDLGPAADDRPAEHGAIDRRVGADVHVVLDHDGTDLRDLAMAAAVEDVAESVAADDGAGLDDHTAPEPHPFAQNDARMEHRLLAHLDERPDIDERMHPDPRPYDRARGDHRQGTDRGARVHVRVARHDGQGVDAGRCRRGGMEQREQRDQGLLRGARAQERTRQARHLLGDEQGAGTRRLGGRAISGIDQEGDLLWSGRVERRHAGDATARVALERRAEGLGKLPEREPGGRSHQGGFFAGACLSRRASGVIRGPFFSSSSRSFSSSWRLPSISFCITDFSRSSCSRAATPADDRARTRWTSM